MRRSLFRRLTWLAVGAVCALASPAFAQVAADASSSGTANAGSLSWSHTVGSGTGRFLVVGISIRGIRTVTGITYGAAALTFVGTRANHDNTIRVEMWSLVGPPSGTATITVTLSGSAKVVGGGMSFTGVDPAAPLGTFASLGSTSAGSTTPSVNVTSAANDLVVDVLATEGNAGTITPGAGQTQRWNLFSGTSGGDVAGAGSTEPGAASVTMSWTSTSNSKWAIGAVSVTALGQPQLNLSKSVIPSGSQLPGSDLEYTVLFSNTGNAGALSLIVTDTLPENVDFKIGSVTTDVGTTGLSVVVEYSDDNGASYVYMPSSGAGGAPANYDRNVTNVRWTFTGTLSATVPNNAATVGFTARIQ